MRIVVTGGSGMLGHNLMRWAHRSYEVWGSYHTHRVDIPGCSMFTMDLSNEKESKNKIKSVKPEVVIHTAALTDVDECNRQPAWAGRINAEGTKILAEVSEEINARFVYISTDYVFDGEKGDYREQDEPSPVNRYGETKLLGEESVRRFCSRALILRTTMFGLKIPPTRGLMETLVGALRSGQPLSRFTDQYFTPVYTGQFSEIILRLVSLGAEGLFHIGPKTKVSRYEFALRVAELFKLSGAEIRPVPFQQIQGLARRPRNTSLVSQEIERRWGIQLPSLPAGLAQLKRDWENLPDEGGVSR